MAKAVHPDVLDGSLGVISTANAQVLVNGEPADRAAAISGALAEVAMAGGDFSLAAGDTSGRKVTVSAKSEVPIDSSGEANHVALVDGTRLLYVTTCPPQQLVAGGTVDIGSWKVEIGNPT